VGRGTGGYRGGNVGVTAVSIGTGSTAFVESFESASFADYPASWGVSISDTAIGACRVIRVAGTGTTLPLLDVGPVTLSGGTGSAIVMTANATARNAYSNMQPGLRFALGDLVTAMASGSIAFAGNLTFPAAVTVTSPTATPGTPIAISRTTDFTVRWTGTGADPVAVILTVSNRTAGTSSQLLCTFDRTTGIGVVPATTLGMIDAGAGQLAVVGVNTTRLTGTGNMPIEMTARNTTLASTAQVN